MRTAAIGAAHRTGGKAVSISVIEPTAAAAPASAEVRNALETFAREGYVNAAAIVIEGTGFRAAAARTIVAGMYIVARRAYPHKIVATPAGGAAWLVEALAALGIAQAAAELVDAVEKARAAIR